MKHLDLFSGIGGFALAAKWAGFETAAFCEIDPYCQRVLRKNFGRDIIIHNDIRELNGKQYADIDLLTGGFPCQPYSVAGKRRGDKDPRALWGEMRRIIHEARFTWVVGENVAHFINMALDASITDLEDEDYEVQSFIIPAVAIGAWHRRERVFFIAHANGERWSTGRNTESQYQIQDNEEWDAAKIEPTWFGWQRWFGQNFQDWYRSRTGARILGDADGIPHRVDRLRGLGNAVVPQQVYPILKAIMDTLPDMTENSHLT